MVLQKHYAEHGLLVGGIWRTASDGATLASVNPATEEHLGDIPQASAADVSEAITSATSGFDKMRALTAWERSALLRRVAVLVRERSDILGRLVALETSERFDLARGPLIRGRLIRLAERRHALLVWCIAI